MRRSVTLARAALSVPFKTQRTSPQRVKNVERVSTNRRKENLIALGAFQDDIKIKKEWLVAKIVPKIQHHPF